MVLVLRFQIIYKNETDVAKRELVAIFEAHGVLGQTAAVEEAAVGAVEVFYVERPVTQKNARMVFGHVGVVDIHLTAFAPAYESVLANAVAFVHFEFEVAPEIHKLEIGKACARGGFAPFGIGYVEI